MDTAQAFVITEELTQAPIPPAPVADPAARIAQPRRVVSASFVR